MDHINQLAPVLGTKSTNKFTFSFLGLYFFKYRAKRFKKRKEGCLVSGFIKFKNYKTVRYVKSVPLYI